MADVADFHFSSSLLDSFNDEDEEIETQDSFSYWPYDFEHEDVYCSEPDPDDLADLADHLDDQIEEEEQENEVDLDSESVQSEMLTPISIVDEDDLFRVEDDVLGLRLGLGGIHGDEEDEDGGGIGVVGLESNPEEEGDEAIDGVDFDLYEEDGLVEVQDPLCWDCLQLDEDDVTRYSNNEFYEWEDVGDRFEDGVVPNVEMDFDQRLPSLDSMVVEGEETMVESISVEDTEERRVRNLEWQVLLQFERNEHDFDQDDFALPAEYDMLLGQFAENDNAIHGSPPAARSVIENLPSIVLTEDDVKTKASMCAVCKDEISTQEPAKLLPCSHCYHGDCILPWLCIRNTCPVCRFELPTDDPEYERRRTQRANCAS